MKIAKNCVKDMVLDMPLKNGSGLITLVNCFGILKLWAIAHENSRKCKNGEFLIMPLKHVLDITGLVNRLEP